MSRRQRMSELLQSVIPSPKRLRPRRPSVALTSLLVTLLVLGGLWFRSFGDRLKHPVSGVASEETDDDQHVVPDALKARGDFVLQPRVHALREPCTQEHRWRITSNYSRPDGVLTRVYLINDEFPGPTLEARPGDRIVVVVENELADAERVDLRWHGLDGTIDDVPASIAPGESTTFNFTIDPAQHGTFWYSAQNPSQQAYGLYGGFVVHSPIEDHHTQPLDEELLLLIGGWYHQPFPDAAARDATEPFPSSVLLNGIGSFPCLDSRQSDSEDCNVPSTPLTELHLTTSKRNILRVVHIGLTADIRLGILGSELTTLSIDGNRPQTPKPSKLINRIRPGERVDLLVDLGSVIARYHSQLDVRLQPSGRESDVQPPSQSFPVHWYGTL